MASAGEAPLTAGAYGSSLCPNPRTPGEYYGLTDRGPNVDVNPEASTKETIVDLDGALLDDSEFGYDPEGLVAMPDGTFYISDEYGLCITHSDAAGRQLDRLSPFDGTLPAELRTRDPNEVWRAHHRPTVRRSSA